MPKLNAHAARLQHGYAAARFQRPTGEKTASLVFVENTFGFRKFYESEFN